MRIVCTGFGDSSVNFELVYDHRSDDYQHVLGTQGEIVISILDLFIAGRLFKVMLYKARVDATLDVQ